MLVYTRLGAACLVCGVTASVPGKLVYHYSPGAALYMLEAFAVKLERLVVLESGAYPSGQKLDTPAKILAVRRPDLIYLVDAAFVKPQKQDILIAKDIVKRGKKAFIMPQRTRVSFLE